MENIISKFNALKYCNDSLELIFFTSMILTLFFYFFFSTEYTPGKLPLNNFIEIEFNNL